jgi:glycosyl transferase family 25
MLDIFVINLKNRIDRFERIKKDFSHPGINLIRFEAIQKNPGWIGLYETNKLILKKAIDENLDSIIIIEDDCKIDYPINEFYIMFTNIKAWLDKNPDKWDIYNGGSNLSGKELKLGENIFFKNKINNGNNKSYFFQLNMFWKCTQFMYINKNSFTKIYNDLELKCWDVFLNKYKTIITYPQLSSQFNNYSDIEKRNVNYNHYFNKTKINLKYFIIRNKLL